MDTVKSYERTAYCAQFGVDNIGQEVSVCGWVQGVRDLGSLLFIDLRDRTGILQLAFDGDTPKEVFEKASAVRAEHVVAAKGTIRERSSKNKDIPTGDIELEVKEFFHLSASDTPPFEIEDDTRVNEALRLKYRYLDLRRPSMQQAIALRHRITKIARDYFDENGFLEIETPMLTKSTPEGARDYLVPSRIHKGCFYALPQSPQQYKQLLMLAGFDRYMQVVRCFRDEDLRADRQPEFTQIDLEMSFVTEEDIMRINEGFLKRAFREVLGVEIHTPFLRMTYAEAMDRFGSDKPDMRFGYELKDITNEVKGCGFGVFSSAVSAGGSVRLINVKDGARFSRKEIDSLTEFVKTYGAKGLAWVKLADTVTSSFSKFMSESEMDSILEKAEAEKGDLILVVADADNSVVFASLGALRCECARRMGIIPEGEFKFLWVTQFPLFEYSKEEGRLVAMHHPFTAPMEEDLALLTDDPASCRARAYDIVLNGTELGGGSIRIFRSDVQEKMFEALGFTEERALAQFGHLIEAFRYGAPPHGGMAYGLDRLVMLMTGRENIRDVIAFPKVQNASELMMASPAPVEKSQLDELGLRLV
ncbi:MAG: aspartate--tRNA ligase [Oscillospiraceae bacterium]|nr:aspartate--tRNA ligase [Oscillospiraceae bacterium]